MSAARTISISPNASALIGSLRGLGYSPETALADLIDNSITAGASTVAIDLQWNAGAPIVAILDDGRGMGDERLADALRLGGDGPDSQRAVNDLGRFGMGLKTASLSQSRRMTIVTKITGGTPSVASLDVTVVERRGWIALIPDNLPEHPLVTELIGQSNGTVIIWDQLDELSGLAGLEKEAFYLRLEDIRAHLGMVFHRFISGDATRLAILLNGRPVKAWDPFHVSHSATTELPSERIRHAESSFIVKPYVLPHRDRFSNETEYNAAGGPGGWGARQGFYVYRGKRLLVAGSWLGLGGTRTWTRDEASRLARLLIDLPTGLDRDWRIDVRKSQARPPGALRGRLTAIAGRCRAEAREVFAFRGQGPRLRGAPKTAPTVWLATPGPRGIQYRINRDHPVIAALRHSTAGKRSSDAVLSIIERSVPVERIWLDVSESEGVQAPTLDGEEIVQLANQLAELGRMLPETMTIEQRIDALLLNMPGNVTELKNVLKKKVWGISMTDIAADLSLTARRSLLSRKNNGEVITQEIISQALQLLAPAYAALSQKQVGPEDIAAAARMLLTTFVTEQGPALVLQEKEGSRPAPWYVGDRRQPGPFMQRYLEKLEDSGWPVESVQQLQDSTARILELMDDPQRPGNWDWRGLVVGDVQSGKTASYAGVANRAADAGYRIIIVLAGMHKILRLQTQRRFDQDVLGYDTNPKTRQPNQPLREIGVGTFNSNLLVDSLTMADLNGDFSLRIAEQTTFSPDSKPCLFIVKKNATVLKNLNSWVARLPVLARGAPALIIDDEADQASVDTGDQPLLEDGTFDEDYDPKRVNGEIRKLLMKFERRVYVGYTATPFANIFIHDERNAKDYGPDLFPATFIASLTPPDDYFGPAAVFGTNDGDNPGLPLIRPLDQSGEEWIPERHDKTYKPRFSGCDVIPPSLERAIDAFLLTCAARAARGQGREHNSMLVHVSRFVDVHAEVHRQVEKYLTETRAMISNGDGETLRRLKEIWETDYVRTTNAVAQTIYGRNTLPVTWSQVRTQLADSSDKIQLITSNGKTKADIDYDAYTETGFSVIAVGGDKLSRGLTLEGLSVSYFLRISRQYDSLLQMGRWFGYRRGFADLCRLYTTADMEDWFRYVATAQSELRAQFFEMAMQSATPKQFGLKVAVHDILEVTALNKQRHAEVHQSSYAGEGKVQTVMFRDRSTIERNADVTERFILGLGIGLENPARPGAAGKKALGALWGNVPGQNIAGYLRAMTFPPESQQINGEKLASYITDQIAMPTPELTEWTVFLATGTNKEVTIAGKRYGCVERQPRPSRNGAPLPEDRFIIGTALSPLDQAIDLSDAEFAQALVRTNAERRSRAKADTDVPSGEFIRKVRGARPHNGLLIIYPIDPILAKVDATEHPVYSIVVSFPDSSAADKRIYLINSVKQRELS